jgi:hypothetical protein
VGRAQEVARVISRRASLIATAALLAAALALAAPGAASAQGSSSCSSASSAYGGQGQSLTPCSSQLPFTGLDLAGVLAVGVVLIGAGVGLRWGMRRTGRRAS